MKAIGDHIKFYIGLLILLIGLFGVCYLPTQSDFATIAWSYTMAFCGYSILIRFAYATDRMLMSVCAIAPLFLIFSLPNLSDDVYRFLWDGYSVLNGISPYRYLPSELVSMDVGPLSEELFSKLNSKDYYSIYPTVNQIIFAITAFVAKSFENQVLIMKTVYLLIHILGVFYLYKTLSILSKPKSLTILYALNPLVLVEGIGNLHAEILMVAFMYISLYCWLTNRHALSALLFGMAINVKLIPAFLLLYFIVRIQKVKFRRYLLLVSLFSFLLFSPVLYGFISGGFLESLDLYFRKFEFNASIYYLLRWVGFHVFGYNLIAYLGPLLMVIFLLFSFKKVLNNRHKLGLDNFLHDSIFVLTLFLICSTTIHPWYVIGLLGFCPFIHFRYMIIWSFLAIFTYINYSYLPYHENLLVVAIEYVVVLSYMGFELLLQKRSIA